MPAKWQTWMPFHIDKFRGSPEVQAMHPSARSGYLYLLASAWQTDDCSISADPIDLATESGLGDELWAVHGPRILRKFITREDGRLQNDVLHAEWVEAKRIFEEGQEEREVISRTRSEAGRRGNRKRWGDRKTKLCDEELSQNTTFATDNNRKRIANHRLTVTGTDTLPSSASQKLDVREALPCCDGSEYFVDDAMHAECQRLYPGLDVDEQLRNMRGWLLSHQRQGKTRRGMPAFVHSWLKRERSRPPEMRSSPDPSVGVRQSESIPDAEVERLRAKMAGKKSAA